jgi:hypothetical protein
MLGMMTLDVAPGSPVSIGLVFFGLGVGLMMLECGILALFGMRPVGRAFINGFFANLAAFGAAVVVYIATMQLDLEGIVVIALVLVTATVVQGLVLSAHRGNFPKSRAWLAAVTMKACSFLIIVALGYLLD